MPDPLAGPSATQGDTIEYIDRRFTGRIRHYVFLRYVLGERTMDALFMSHALRDEPLTLAEMRHVAERWKVG